MIDQPHESLEAGNPPAEFGLATQSGRSRWGAGDERGSANHMSRRSVLRAASLITTGETVELAHVLNASMPMSHDRSWRLYSKPVRPGRGANRRSSHDEVVVAEIGQLGTHIDGLGHQSHAGCFYGGFSCQEVLSASGLTKLGVEKLGTLMTRGVLVDIAGSKDVETLPAGYEVTVADIEKALSICRLRLEPGDAVLLRYGWQRHWAVDPAAYRSNAPGIGVAAGAWLVEQDPMLIGADSATVEIAENPDRHLSLPVHQLALVTHGVLLLENLKLEALASAGFTEFAFVAQPLKIEGASGSTVAPVAVR